MRTEPGGGIGQELSLTSNQKKPVRCVPAFFLAGFFHKQLSYPQQFCRHLHVPEPVHPKRKNPYTT